MGVSLILAFFGFMAASFLAALTGAFIRPGEWYERLKKPSWRPPNWLFAPVWTVPYVMIALSGWLVWRETRFTGAALPLAVYALQLTLNAAYPAFFRPVPPRFRLRRHCSAVVVDRRNHSVLHPGPCWSRFAARALSRVGNIRRSAQFCNLAAESTGGTGLIFEFPRSANDRHYISTPAKGTELPRGSGRPWTENRVN